LFDIGWTELVVVAIVAILVVGPKDLPGMLRGFGRTVTSLRRMARDFQKQFDDALKEAELDDVGNISGTKAFKPLEDARKSMEAYQKQVRGALNDDTPRNEPPPPKPAAEKEAAPSTPKAATKRAAAKARPAARAPRTNAPKPEKTASKGKKKTSSTT
jgi:sec-independent protein translocase protein TatB